MLKVVMLIWDPQHNNQAQQKANVSFILSATNKRHYADLQH